jgi:hypothetical protein
MRRLGVGWDGEGEGEGVPSSSFETCNYIRIYVSLAASIQELYDYPPTSLHLCISLYH